MWIRSQSKGTLINTHAVYLSNNKIADCGSGDQEFLIAEYETRERALEVLDQIQK